MAGLPIAALLAQMRTCSGSRLPEEVAKIVASFVPTGFDLLMPMRPNRRTLAHQCAWLHTYITIMEESEDGWTDEELSSMLEDTTVAVMQLVGVRGPTARVTMLSIFAPPLTINRGRASRIASAGLRLL